MASFLMFASRSTQFLKVKNLPLQIFGTSKWLHVYGLKIPPDRKDLLTGDNKMEEKLYDLPAEASYEKTIAAQGDKPYIAMHKIVIEGPRDRVKLIPDEKENPWVSRTRKILWKKKEILEGLETFLSTFGRGFHRTSREVTRALNDPDDELSPKFKHKLRFDHQKVIVVPQIKGVSYMTPRSLNIKINYFKGQGLSTQETCKMFSEWPKLLNEEVHLVQKKLDVLFGAGYTRRSVLLLLKKAPRALSLPLETHFEEKVSTIKDLMVSPRVSRLEAIDMLQRCPYLLANRSQEMFHDKVKYMRHEIKFTREQIRNMIMRQPQILTLRMDHMKDKVEFCQDILGATVSSIAKCPRLFQCSLERLQERHAFLYTKNLVGMDTKMDDYGLGVMATAPDKTFAVTVGKVSLEEYQEFLEHYRKNRVQNEKKESKAKKEQQHDDLDKTDDNDANSSGQKKWIIRE